ncbi:hypothetical protein ACJIZ3_003076 [Penstemon smallii]|uniref:T-complex protein 11 n=1 Tax=Penstemon smallii TaxID=265156 RepID=A0ABD3UBZ7_9LAMI
MDAGVGIASPDTKSIAGTVLNIPGNDDISECATPKLPGRLRRRLLESKSTTISAQDIEAKLHHAYLRRQLFYESLSSKARPKSKSGCSSSKEKYLGQRLKAKHNAAEQKRLSILAQIQNRLARTDQLRQNAKNGAQLRFLKQLEELSTKVKSRVQQAEVNRMLLLNACRQKQVTKREKASQLLMRRLIQEKKNKECIRAAIHQKHNVAERKRLGFVEAQQLRARAGSVQVQQAVCSADSQRVVEKKKLQNQLEGRLHRAKRFRAEYMRKRGHPHNSGQASTEMVKQKELFSKLIRCWRRFVKLKGTTSALAKAFEELKINNKSVKSMPFENLAVLLGSRQTIHIVKSLLHRLESRIIVRKERNGINSVFHMENIDHLLERVAIPDKTVGANNSSSSNKKKSVKGVAQSSTKLCRYPVRVVLGAYIISGHPDVVSCGMKEYGTGLVGAAEDFSQEFELLIRTTLQRPSHSSEISSCAPTVSQLTFSSQLEIFDKAWCSYLHHFVTWKVEDAKLFDEDLIRAAHQLEVTRMHYKQTLEGDPTDFTHMKPLLDQVTQRQRFQQTKVQRISGNDGIEHMKTVLSDKSVGIAETMELGISSTSSLDHLTSPSSAGSSVVLTNNNSVEDDHVTEDHHSVGLDTRSMFKQQILNSHGEIDSASPGSIADDHQTSDQMLVTENAVIVNEYVHGHYGGLVDSLNNSNEEHSSIKSIVRDTMEKAFWDGLMETLKQDVPDYSWVLKLIKEVRDELCELSPSTWRQEIEQSIDLDILSQVSQMGTLDIEYCGRILEFSSVTLQKLSAPAKEDELKTAHQKLLRDLAEISQFGDGSTASFALVVMRGLRFVLKKIQELKHEMSKARISMLEPLIKGPAGLEYLRSNFANHYGSPSDAPGRLPFVTQWLSAVSVESEQNWNEYLDSLSAMKSRDGEYSKQYTPTALHAGGSVLKIPSLSASSSVAGVEQPECTGILLYPTCINVKRVEQPKCKGEKLDVLLRLGLLNLVSEVEGLAAEKLPETLQLNLVRLRSIQSQLQKIIVICTSILVLRQALVSEHLVTNATDMENMMSDCVKRLSELFDGVEDVGISVIIEIMNSYPNTGEEDAEKKQARKDIMLNMLGKSLSAGNAVFLRVSRSVYLAARGIVLGGSGVQGKRLAETELKRIGAALLTQKLVDAVEGLVVMANVSSSVHGAWYEQVLRNI